MFCNISQGNDERRLRHHRTKSPTKREARFLCGVALTALTNFSWFLGDNIEKRSEREKMSDNSIWESTKMPEFPSAIGELKTDVLIVGGGISGLLTAFELQKSGVSCIVAERRRVCGGITRRTTAKVTSQHGLIYQKIYSGYGAEKAKMYLDANQRALKNIAALCRDIDCGFRTADNYIYSRTDRTALEREIWVLEKLGFSAEFCECADLPISTVGAVKFKHQAQFDPMKFLRGVVEKMSKNVRIFENTEIVKLKNRTALSESAKITAEKIVVATHFPFVNTHGSYFLKLYQSRSNVIALENVPDLNDMYMDSDTNGLSFRGCGDLLLIGGGAHKTGERCRRAELEAFAAKAYPNSPIKFAWGAQDCISLDGIPYIGNYSALTPNMYVAAGFNKWGMTSSMAAAEILRDKVLGRKNPYAEVFDPSRSILKKQLWINGASAVKNLLTPTAPRCPHMGCALKWNSAENTWDCPCHGSRFSKDGKLLDNPAKSDLNRR